MRKSRTSVRLGWEYRWMAPQQLIDKPAALRASHLLARLSTGRTSADLAAHRTVGRGIFA
jgi:hypothetical protein